MSQKTYLFILKAGIYASLLVVFFVYKSLLFPFITSKQISFNIIIEVLFVLWLAFIIKYPTYRPKMSYITYGLAAFFAALFASSIFGVDFNLSFWGDVERMLGVFHLLHFFAFYLIIITAFREWKDWKPLFIISVFFSVIVGLYGYSDAARQISTIGNPAYVSGYLIFNMYFALLLFFREQNPVLKWTYAATLIPNLLGFRMAGTSGAYVGLGASIILVFLIYAFLGQNKKVKITTMAIGLFFAAFVGFVFMNKNQPWVSQTPFLNAATGISFQKNTFQSRLISWKAAARDFMNHPILGTGHGNFAIIFDRHFTPDFYDHTRGETYFDRAHNNVIDIGSTAGVVGLAAYLSIFAALAYYLIAGYRRQKIGLNEFALLSGLITAYFVQNLAVFDSLVTYMGLMMTLGYVYWLYNADGGYEAVKDRPLENREIYAIAGVGLLIFVIMYQFNVKPLKMLVATINGQRAWAQGMVTETIDIYKQALSYNTVLDRDSRTSLNRLFANNPDVLNGLDKNAGQAILDYNIELAEANVRQNEADSLNLMLLAQLLNTAASYHRDNPEKFAFYAERALNAIDRSIAASPGRVPIYFQKAQIYITRGEPDKAIETLKYAHDMHPPYFDSACYLGRTLLFYQREDEGYSYIEKCLDLGGAQILSPASYVKGLINHYVEAEDWERTAVLYARLLALEPNDADNWVKAAKLYADTGEKDKAVEAALRAAELNPAYRQYADDFVNELR